MSITRKSIFVWLYNLAIWPVNKPKKIIFCSSSSTLVKLDLQTLQNMTYLLAQSDYTSIYFSSCIVYHQVSIDSASVNCYMFCTMLMSLWIKVIIKQQFLFWQIHLLSLLQSRILSGNKGTANYPGQFIRLGNIGS